MTGKKQTSGPWIESDWHWKMDSNPWLRFTWLELFPLTFSTPFGHADFASHFAEPHSEFKQSSIELDNCAKLRRPFSYEADGISK